MHAGCQFSLVVLQYIIGLIVLVCVHLFKAIIELGLYNCGGPAVKFVVQYGCGNIILKSMYSNIVLELHVLTIPSHRIIEEGIFYG